MLQQAGNIQNDFEQSGNKVPTMEGKCASLPFEDGLLIFIFARMDFCQAKVAAWRIWREQRRGTQDCFGFAWVEREDIRLNSSGRMYLY